MKKINTYEALDKIEEFWSPKIAGEINDSDVKLAKLKGEFDKHHHEDSDEMFFVLKGELTIELPKEEKILSEGEFIIIPKGKDHKPIAKEETHLMLFEKKSTLNTGNKETEKTKKELEKID